MPTTYKITMAELLARYNKETGKPPEAVENLPGWFREAYPGCTLKIQWNPGLINLEARIDFDSPERETYFWLQW